MKVDTVQLTDNIDVTLTCYVQKNSDEMKNMKKKKAILIFPGGGYMNCSDREAEPIALAYLNQGYNAFVLHYSVKEASKWPRPLNDAEAAMKYLKTNYEELCIDKDKIAVIGFSAGGHLAAWLATSGRIRPDALLLGYPTLFRDPYFYKYPTPVVDDLSPEAFVFHTTADDYVPQTNSLYFANAYDEKHIPLELHIFRDGLHGLSLGSEITYNTQEKAIQKEYQNWLPLSILWLNKVLG